MNPFLTVREGYCKGKLFELSKPEISIGRAGTNVICLKDDRISRNHALIKKEQDGYTISDLQSSNGTYVNGRPVSSPVMIKPGDAIVLGNITLSFSVSGQKTPAGKPGSGTVISLSDTDTNHAIKTIIHPGDAKPFLDSKQLSSQPVRLQRAHEDLSVLYQFGNRVNQIFDIEELFNFTLDFIFETFHADRSFFVMLDPDTDQPDVHLVKRMDGLSEKRLFLSKTILEQVKKRKSRHHQRGCISRQAF